MLSENTRSLQKYFWSLSIKAGLRAFKSYKKVDEIRNRENLLGRASVLMAGFKSPIDAQGAFPIVSQFFNGEIEVHLDAAKRSTSFDFRNYDLLVTGDEREILASHAIAQAKDAGCRVISIPDPHRLLKYLTPAKESLTDALILPSRKFLPFVAPQSKVLYAISPEENDLLQATLVVPRQMYREKLGGSSERILILHAMQGFPMDLEVVNWLSDLKETFPIDVVHRPHPAQNAYADLALCDVNCRRNLSAHEAVYASDLIVAHSSAMAAHGVAWGRKVVLYGEQDAPSFPQMVSTGDAVWLPTKEEFTLTCSKIIQEFESELESVHFATAEQTTETQLFLKGHQRLCAGI